MKKAPLLTVILSAAPYMVFGGTLLAKPFHEAGPLGAALIMVAIGQTIHMMTATGRHAIRGMQFKLYGLYALVISLFFFSVGLSFTTVASAVALALFCGCIMLDNIHEQGEEVYLSFGPVLATGALATHAAAGVISWWAPAAAATLMFLFLGHLMSKRYMDNALYALWHWAICGCVWIIVQSLS